MGIDRKLQDVLILVYAAQAKRSLWLGDSPYTQTKVGAIPDDCELREQKLPDEKTWEAARGRAASVFGLAPGSLRTASEVARLTKDLREQTAELREGAGRLVQQLGICLTRIGFDRDESDRWQAANDGAELLAALDSASDDAAIGVLANASLDPSAAAVGTTLKRAGMTSSALQNDGWPALEKVLDLADQNQEASAIRDLTLDLFRLDEHASPENGRLAELVRKAAELLAGLAPPAQPGPREPESPGPATAATPPGFTRVDAGRKEHLVPDEAATELERLRELVVGDPALRLTLDWVVERQDDE
jgi:hypothetical protein